MDVWLNGQFISADEASLSIFDAGIQHGIGLFETMAAANGRVFRAEDHIKRLIESARLLRLSERLQVAPLVEAVQLAVTHNSIDRARVRLTVTGGNLNMLQATGSSPHDPTVLVVVQPPTEYPDAFFEKGVAVTVANGRLSPWTIGAGHKTLDYWSRIHALQEAAAVRAGEALWLTPDAHIACGSVSNVFLVKDDALLTPPARTEAHGGEPSPVLPGVTRAAVLELAAGRRIERRPISVDDLLGADEMFMTNSSWQILPVTSLLLRARTGEGEDAEVALQMHTIGEGDVGPVTSDLRTALLALIERETTS